RHRQSSVSCTASQARSSLPRIPRAALTRRRTWGETAAAKGSGASLERGPATMVDRTFRVTSCIDSRMCQRYSGARYLPMFTRVGLPWPSESQFLTGGAFSYITVTDLLVIYFGKCCQDGKYIKDAKFDTAELGIAVARACRRLGKLWPSGGGKIS